MQSAFIDSLFVGAGTCIPQRPILCDIEQKSDREVLPVKDCRDLEGVSPGEATKHELQGEKEQREIHVVLQFLQDLNGIVRLLGVSIAFVMLGILSLVQVKLFEGVSHVGAKPARALLQSKQILTAPRPLFSTTDITGLRYDQRQEISTLIAVHSRQSSKIERREE